MKLNVRDPRLSTICIVPAHGTRFPLEFPCPALYAHPVPPSHIRAAPPCPHSLSLDSPTPLALPALGLTIGLAVRNKGVFLFAFLCTETAKKKSAARHAPVHPKLPSQPRSWAAPDTTNDGS